MRGTGVTFQGVRVMWYQYSCNRPTVSSLKNGTWDSCVRYPTSTLCWRGVSFVNSLESQSLFLGRPYQSLKSCQWGGFSFTIWAICISCPHPADDAAPQRIWPKINGFPLTTPTPTALPPSEMRLQSFRPVCILQVPSEFHRIRFLKDSFTQPASLTTGVPYGLLGLLDLYLCWRHLCLCHLPKYKKWNYMLKTVLPTVWSYLSSTRLILHVVSRSNLRADIL